MKKLFIAIAVLININILIAQIPTNGLVAYYPFSGNANDYSGNGNNGTNNGATLTTDRFGQTNKAYYFNGSSSITVPNSVTMNPSSKISISVWVQTTNSHTNAGIVGKWNVLGGSSGGTEQYVLVANNTGVMSALKTSYQTNVSEGTISYNNGNWHHYCVVWDGLTSKLFKDGVFVNSSTLTGTITSYNQNFEIGKYAGGIFSYLFFTGKIDDIRIYNRDISTSEVVDLYNETSNTLVPGSISSYIKFSSTTNNLPFTLTNQDYFGWDIENIGDINKDGINDIAIAYGHSSYNGYTKVGCVMICFMDTNRTIKSYTRIGKNSGGFTEPLSSNSYFGGFVANIGDRNGDGINDIMVGQENSTLCYVIYLDTNGYVKNYFKIGSNQGGMGSISGYFGTGGVSLGDIDHDGISDTTITSYSGYVYICRLNANGSVKAYTTISGTNVSSQLSGFGVSIDTIGDLDGNGVVDIAVGNFYYNGSTGAVYLIKLDTNFTVKSYSSITNGTANFPTISSYSYFGGRICNAGDFDFDGVNDLLIGASAGGYGPGEVYSVCLNSDLSVKSYYKIGNSSPNFINIIPYGTQFGSALCRIGDLNNDGIDEYAIGANKDNDGGTNRGAFYMISLNKAFQASSIKSNISCYGQCNGSIALNTFGGIGNKSYIWNTGDTTSSLSNLCAGTYTCTITDQAAHTIIKTITITQPAKNITTVPADTAICVGSCITLSVSGTGGVGPKTIYWNNGLGTGTSKTVCPANTTSYYVYQIDSTNCMSDGDTIIVITKPLPVASFSGLAPNYCINSSAISLTGYPAGGVFSGSGVSGTNFSPSTAGAGNHYITYTATVNGCSDTSMQKVNVYTNPTVVLSGLSSNYCRNSAADTIIGSPSGGIFGGNGITGNIFTPSLLSAGNYTITYSFSDSIGCSGQDTHIVHVYNFPNANAGSNQLIIPGSTITLMGTASNGSGMYSYFWTPSDSFYYPAVQNATTKPLFGINQFILTVTDLSSNCLGKDTVQVGMSTIPTTTNTSAYPSSICNGSSSQITSSTLGGVGIYTYSWTSNPSGFSSSQKNPVVSPTVTTTYYVTVTDGFTSDIDTIIITVNPVLQPNLGNDTVLCNGASINLSANAGASSYLWSTGATSQNLNINTSSMSAGLYPYSVAVTNSFGCVRKDTIILKVSQITPVNLGNDTFACSGPSNIGSVLLNAGPAYASYSWYNNTSNSQTFNVISPFPCGPLNIDVKVTNADGCISRDTVHIEFYCNPTLNLGPDTLLCGVSNMLLDAGTGGGANEPVSYLWNTGNTSQYQLINGSNYNQGTYTFNVLLTTTTHACKGRDSINVTFSHIQDIDMGLDTAICKTQTLSLDAGSGYLSYFWSTGSTAQSIVIDSLMGIGPKLIHVRANDSLGCWAMDTIVVTINECFGIDNPSNEDAIHIFPNPSKGIFYIEANSIESIDVLEINGKLLLKNQKKSNSNGRYEIDLSKLDKGVYLLELKLQDSIHRKRVIIQ